MQILLSYASESDKGEGRHYRAVLERLGHHVHVVNAAADDRGPGGRLVAGYPADTRIERLVDQFGPADLFLYVEPLGLLPRGLERAPMTTACVISDVHRNLPPRLRLAKFFDAVLLYQRNYRESFTDHPAGNVRWFPYACDLESFRDLGVARDLDVAFIGQMFGADSERRRIIGALRQRYRMNEDRYYTQDEIPGVYSRARIVLNLPVGGDLNFRVFEALSCGAMLLTRRASNGQELLFSEGVHYAAFGSERELFDRIDYYLAHEDERAAIARAGWLEVQQRHSLEGRVSDLLAALPGLPRKAPIRTMTESDRLALYADAYERMGRVDALLSVSAEQRRTPDRLRATVAGIKSFARRSVGRW